VFCISEVRKCDVDISFHWSSYDSCLHAQSILQVAYLYTKTEEQKIYLTIMRDKERAKVGEG